MVEEPVIFWSTTRLVAVGVGVTTMGAGLLVASAAEGALDASRPASLLLGGSIGAMTWWELRQNPEWVEYLILVSTLLAVLIPLLVSVATVRRLARIE